PLAGLSWRWCFGAVAAGALICAGAWVAVSPRLRRVSSARPATPDPPFSASPPSRRDRLTAWTFAAVVGANAVLALTVISVSFDLQQGHGWSATQMGWGFLPSNGAAAVGALVVARLGARASAHRLLIVGMIVLGVSCVGLATASPTPITLLVITIPVGLGIGMVFPIANHGTLETAGTRPLGRAAALGAAQQAGLAAGAVVAATRSDGAVLALAIVVGIGVVTVLALSVKDVAV
ncbi:MAG: MFS transporter, partial [Actinomycetota bacterium]|nr:MFS transporter [Actinomycetota bacterium]